MALGAFEASRGPIVVVGNGMVGHRLCERLVELGVAARRPVTVLGEESRPAYDRVHLSEFFAGRTPEELALADPDWYREHGLALRLDARVTAIDPAAGTAATGDGETFAWGDLVLATGSAPFVPPIPGTDLPGCFVYRTIEDLEAIRAWAASCRRAAVIGGGLLGLEAAKACQDLGLETHVVEFADRLMPRQVDGRGGAVLREAIEALGVRVHTGARTEAILGEDRVAGLRMAGEPDLPFDLVLVSAGIRPRDELARAAGLAVGQRGGIVVDDTLATSAAGVSAIGECALHRGALYGLVAPGWSMADALARRFAGEDARFEGADLSTRLKLLGIDVASFGDAFADQHEEADELRSVVFEDPLRGVYQKLLVRPAARRLVGGILVGDAGPFGALLDATRRGLELPERVESLLFAGAGAAAAGAEGLDDACQVCTCNDVTKGALRQAIEREALTTLGGVKACTRAGTGCGGCVPLVQQVLDAELARAGRSVVPRICEHFAYTREELFWIVKLGRVESFDALLASHGEGDGCEVCRPAVASIFAATWNDFVLEHASLQDTNDRFLANIQRGGSYSVIPRVPGGEITPEKLIALGEIAREHDLYCKITGGQRIDLLGARVEQLPDVWEALVAAGFESGHAYAKALRTVKSCVGSTWCRYGVQDSTAFAIRLEERYRGLRAPHKLKSAVSGCIRECAEAQSKDFGIIATEKGWNVYLCGNGGAKPRHADLFATDCSDEQVISILDRFLMFYLQTAKPLQRTARWLEELDGGLEYLKSVVLDDALGIAEQLEADMQQLVDGYRCEWRMVVEDPELRREFRHWATSSDPDTAPRFVRERGQKRPADWPDPAPPGAPPVSAEDTWSWTRVARVDEIPADGGRSVRHGEAQIAVFHFARRGEWYATENRCPHRKDMVLARGLLGSQGDEPKVACPLHKKTFSLRSGKGLSDPGYSVQTFPVEVRDGEVFVKLPPAESLAGAPCAGAAP